VIPSSQSLQLHACSDPSAEPDIFTAGLTALETLSKDAALLESLHKLNVVYLSRIAAELEQ